MVPNRATHHIFEKKTSYMNKGYIKGIWEVKPEPTIISKMERFPPIVNS